MTRHGILRLPPQTTFGRGTIATLPGVAGAIGTRAFVCSDPNILAQPAVTNVLSGPSRTSWRRCATAASR
jgi:hypothetical protein